MNSILIVSKRISFSLTLLTTGSFKNVVFITIQDNACTKMHRQSTHMTHLSRIIRNIALKLYVDPSLSQDDWVTIIFI